MSRMGSIYNRLTGAAGRHNRALREVTDWEESVEKFLVAYKLLKGKSAAAGLMENSGDAKFDITGLLHKGRVMVVTARDVKDKRVAPLVAGIVEAMDGIRRSMMSPAMQKEKLAGALVVELRENFEALRGALAEISYL
jgi:hypothetical protein